MKIYIDGIIVADTDNSNDALGSIINNQGLQIGSTLGLLYDFVGSIDEVMIFNRSLSAEEIAALYNTTSNRLYHNFTSVSDGTYAYKAYTVDVAGNKNSTETRNVTVDSLVPSVNFTLPTPYNNSNISTSYIPIGVTAADANGVMTFVDFDDSLVSWWRMDDTNQSLGTLGAYVIDYIHRNNGTAVLQESMVLVCNLMGMGIMF